MTGMNEALAKPNQPTATLEALEALVDQTIGVKLFTLMEIDQAGGLARRNYSNMPVAYPASGTKPIEQNGWTEKVQERRETFVANNIEQIAEVFSDFELIKSLGCESCINIPITIGDAVVGTLNCLHDAGHYTPERVAASEALKIPGALAFLLIAQSEKGK